MRFYVAGKHKEPVREAQALVLDEGHEITFDWTQYPDDATEVWLAERERHAVQDADVLILVWADDMCGALLEAGMAMAWRKHVWVLGTDRPEHLFWRLPWVSLFTDLDALCEALRRAA